MGRTPINVVELLKAEIPEKISRNQFCIKTGINQNSIDKYMSGIAEPTKASLEKIANYFEVLVPWLQGHFGDMSYDAAKQHRKVVESGQSGGWVIDLNKVEPEGNGYISGICTRCGGKVDIQKKSFQLFEVDPCSKCCKGNGQ